MASDTMKQGCEKQVGDKGGDCVRQCETAFRVEAKGAVQGLKQPAPCNQLQRLRSSGGRHTAGLGLEDLGVRVNSRGQVEVNGSLQTTHPHIYAVGDVIGPPALASASLDQGRYAATHIVGGTCERRMVESAPTGILKPP